MIIGDVIDNFTNIDIKIKNIIWYDFSMIPCKSDVAHLKFVAMDKNISNLYPRIYPPLGYYSFATTTYIYIYNAVTMIVLDF